MKKRIVRLIAMGMVVSFMSTSVGGTGQFSVQAAELADMTQEGQVVSESEDHAAEDGADVEPDAGQEESSTDQEPEMTDSDTVSEPETVTNEEETADMDSDLIPSVGETPPADPDSEISSDDIEPTVQEPDQEILIEAPLDPAESEEAENMEQLDGTKEAEENGEPEVLIDEGEGALTEALAQDEEVMVRGRTSEAVSAVADRSGRLDTRPLTKIEIANLYQNAKDSSTELSYDIQPSVSAPYAAGRASAANRRSALNEVNMYRQIAGLTPAQESAELSDIAQHGAVVLAANDQLTHNPSQPADMDSSFFEIGYSATTSSNISKGYSRMENGVDGCMRDSSGSNLTSVGHRRWFLNPRLLYMGFGQAQSASSRYFTYKVFDRSNERLDYDFVSWPSSGNFPTELVDIKLPWSVSLNMERYEVPDMGDVVVKITNPQGDTETFTEADNGSGNPSGNEKYFNVNTGGYGSGACIICNFGGNYAAFTQPGTYQVRVTGLKSAATGEAVRIEYETTMFRASDYAGKTAVTDGQYEVIGQFVERLYTRCLGRDSEARGKLDWTMKLADRDISGADAGYGFVFSDEYTNKGTSNSTFLDMMYDVYLGRAADAEGKEYWEDMLDHGVSRKYVFRGFAESAEYGEICQDYGIERGNVELTEGRDLNAGATMFVYRLYDTALEREAEIAGLNDWSGSIARGEKSAQTVAQSFFHSEEFANKGHGDRSYIQVLYRTFMGREYDEAGLNYWLDYLATGHSRDEVLAGFSGSQEFHDIMASYGQA